MPYTTVTDVKRICGYPSTGAPVSDADLTSFITAAQAKVDAKTGTVYWCIEDSGTATSGNSTTITNSAETWTTNQWDGYCVYISEGTNAGEVREIASNTSTAITVANAFTAAIDTTSVYKIIPYCRRNHAGTGGTLEKLDGNGKDEFFVDYYPLQHIRSLVIDTTTVTISKVKIYKDSGRIRLGSTAESSYFADNDYQLIAIDYYYGVYPIPTYITELCAIEAGIAALANQIGGTYDDFTSIQLPEISGTLGEPYMNVRATLQELEKQRDDYYSKFVRKKMIFEVG